MKTTVTAILSILCSFSLSAESGKPLEFTKSCDASECHKSIVQSKHLHPMAKQKRCASCHTAVSGKKHAFTTKTMPKGCLDCHKDFLEPMKDAPEQNKNCTLCHDPHGSPNKHSLVVAMPNLCVRCHPDVGRSMKKDLNQHGDIGQKCTECHDPHNKKGLEFSLKKSIPNLCLDCHKDIKTITNDKANDHKAVSIDDSCLNCHSGHSSNLKHMLRDEPKNLCLFCHKKEIAGQNGRKLPSFTTLLEKRPHHHGPIKENNCSACHANIHGGPGRARLKEKFPEEFYVNYNKDKYGLCFICHERDMLNKENASWTAFRNGNVNLHYLHVNKEKKGRSCRACHEVHASNQSSLISDAVPFGPRRWMMKLKFTPSQTGGGCQPACHKPFKYDRKNEVINLKRGVKK